MTLLTSSVSVNESRSKISSDPSEIVYLDTAEYTVLRKLEWYRRGSEVSERQRLDVLGTLRTQGPRLDRERMLGWVNDLVS